MFFGRMMDDLHSVAVTLVSDVHRHIQKLSIGEDNTFHIQVDMFLLVIAWCRKDRPYKGWSTLVQGM